MALEGVKEIYRDMSIVKKAVLIIAVGSTPGACKYMDEAELLNEDLERAYNARDAAKTKFEKARKQKANLPKLEEQLAFTEAELAKASDKLPDEFAMGKILQKTAMIAQDVGIELNLFQPGQESPAGTVFKYVELPIALQMVGTYGQIATFFDRIVHLDMLVHIKDTELSVAPLESDEDDATANENQPKELTQRERRQNAKLTGSADMVIFRTLTQKEELAIATATQEKKKKDN